MKILITGSNGLLGQKLLDKLRNNNDIQLIATAQGPDRYPFNEGYIYDSLDITNEFNVKTIIQKHKPDCIINTAAMTNVDACETDHEGCDKLNVHAVKYLAQAAEENKARLIHLSTDFIFDGTHGPLKEDEKPKPLSYYGNSKYLGEQMVQQYCSKWAIVRTVLVYGVVHNMSRSNIVLWVKSSLENGLPINVVDDQFRTPTLAEDLADGCIAVATKNAQGIYNISGKEFMSIYDLAQRIAEYWQLNKSLIRRAQSADINQPAKRPPITGFNIGKATAELGYEPHSLEEGLESLHLH
ncbi:MAG: NAD(P)-dependent oxidoreductase [Bacteroidota bacterium]|nr:NAD(P)-dependent oxidoreductase [Bacteroidota bacterium]